MPTKPNAPGEMQVSVTFTLTAAEQLHLFAQWMERNPTTDLSKFNVRLFQQALRDVLSEFGWVATKAKLPDSVELKKIDYRCALRGVVNHL